MQRHITIAMVMWEVVLIGGDLDPDTFTSKAGYSRGDFGIVCFEVTTSGLGKFDAVKSLFPLRWIVDNVNTFASLVTYRILSVPPAVCSTPFYPCLSTKFGTDQLWDYDTAIQTDIVVVLNSVGTSYLPPTRLLSRLG